MLILLIGSFIIGHLFSILLTTNVYSILTAIIIVPILEIPIRLGNYHQQLAGFTVKFNKNPQVLSLLLDSSH